MKRWQAWAAAIAASLPVAAGAGLLGNLVGKGAAAAARQNKAYDEKTLRPADLKTCIVDAHFLDRAAGTIQSRRKLLEAEREVMKAEADVYAAEARLATLGKGPKPDMKALRDKEAAFNRNVDDFNAYLKQVKARNDKFAAACAGKRYYESDLQAVSAGLPPDVRKELAAAR